MIPLIPIVALIAAAIGAVIYSRSKAQANAEQSQFSDTKFSTVVPPADNIRDEIINKAQNGLGRVVEAGSYFAAKISPRARAVGHAGSGAVAHETWDATSSLVGSDTVYNTFSKTITQQTGTILDFTGGSTKFTDDQRAAIVALQAQRTTKAIVNSIYNMFGS